MKKYITIIIGMTAISSLALHAADQKESVSSSATDNVVGHGWAPLTPEERNELKIAHDTAIQKDPVLKQKIEEAKRIFEDTRQSLHDAMIKVKPSIQPILDKLSATRAAFDMKLKKEKDYLSVLTEEEKVLFKKVFEQVKSDPSILTAKEEKKKAVTAEEKHKALENFRNARNAAMIKSEPTIQPILEKLKKAENDTNHAVHK